MTIERVAAPGTGLRRLARRVAIGLGVVVVLAAAALVGVVYAVQYHGKIGPAETERQITPDSALGATCVHGWRKLSTWDYWCEIRWPDGRREEKDVNVDENGVTKQTL